MIETLRQDEHKAFPTAAEMRSRAVDLFSARTFGDLVTYQELADGLGLNPATDHRARGAVLRAGRDVLRQQNKKIVNVKNEGYRIVQPREHRGVSQAQQRAARRRYKAALETVTYVALDKLDAIQVAEVLQEQARAAIMVSMGKKISKVKSLPQRSDLHMPSGPKLIEMMKRTK